MYPIFSEILFEEGGQWMLAPNLFPGTAVLHSIWSYCQTDVLRIYNTLCIRIASSDQVQRQQRRDEPVRENTHLVLDTLASRFRSYHSIVGVESLAFRVIRTQLIYIQSIVCTSG